MSTTTMHFGPEWMRTKHQTSSRPQQPPSPPPTSVPASGASTYSALVSPAHPPQSEKPDEAHPFRYSKEDLLRIYKEGGGKGGLGLEVERWEGVVREGGSEPIGLRDMSDSEKKLFAGPLNSDLRRRQSTDYLSPLSTQSLGTDRSRLNHASPASGTGSPLRERFGTRRRDSNTDQPMLTIPRKQSLSSLQPPLMSPRDTALSSPRTRVGHTPNFDGVLNNGDSWVARRRASEVSLKSSAGTSRDPGDQMIDGKASEIREEEEDGNFISRKEDGHELGSRAEGHSSQIVSGGTTFRDVGADSSHSYNQPAHEHMNNGPPPGIPDLASIEWSYKDPQGQIQGPFRADLMQKWFDEGYFTPDLPMKRTHLDTQWTSVEELILRSGGGRMFMTLPTPALPPGISNRTESPGFPTDHHLFNGPYQPAPLRTLRSSTLDSFGSNPSDSPSSSLGAGRFGDASPDPNAFGGRGYYGDSSAGNRVANFTTLPDSTSAFVGRRPFSDAPTETTGAIRNSTLYGNVGARGPIDNYNFNRAYSPGQSPWNAPPGPHSGFDVSNVSRTSVDTAYSPNFAPIPTNGFNNLHGSQDGMFNESPYQPPLDYNSYNGLNGGSPSLAQQYSHPSLTQYPTPQQIQQLPSTTNMYGQHGMIPDTTTNNSQIVNQIPHIDSTPSPSLWNGETSTTRRPRPFEVSHPTATNTSIIQSSAEASPWGRASQPSRPESRTNEPSPWTSQSVNEEGSSEEPGPNSLTFSNVGQHNQQQLSPIDHVSDTVDIPEQLPSPPVEPTSTTLPEVTAKAPTAPQTKSKTKSSNQANQPAVPKPSPPAPTSPVIPDSSSATVPKPAWAVEDEAKKSKPSGVSISLREIQEAEAKKSEARKVAEREKERAARAATITPEIKDDSQPFTASWGLPTSQAGSRNSAPTPKDTAGSPNPSTPPVWTTTPKPLTTKKTMKEIQEEEERRKKTATKETAAAAARRAYAETTTKVIVPSVQGNAWTTVGPSGKTSAAAPTPARPTVVPSTSTHIVQGTARVNGSAIASRPTSASPTVKAPVPSNPRVDDPVSPSHEFLKWLSEALKGLNNSVNVEEIMSMLLSFPMDPDPSTVELISELIYASSTTLDGRRFAAEFISKRKTDASSRPKGSGAVGRATTKPVSIADVVKAAPKPAQPEWGFKVVNKKKKGGRA